MDVLLANRILRPSSHTPISLPDQGTLAMWTTHMLEKVMLLQWMERQVSDVCVCQLGSGSASGDGEVR